MFEKSKIIEHLTRLETDAGTDAACRHAIDQIASVSGLMKKAIQFTKENREPELGAAYLVMCLSEMAAETNPPPEIRDALENLLNQAIETISTHRATNPVLSRILFTSAMEIQVKLISLESEAPATAKPDQPTPELGFSFAGNMPDVAQREPSRAFRSGKYLMLFLKDVPPVADQIGANPIELRFTYVLAAIDSESRQPTYFVTLESSMMGADFLSTVDSSGAHSNLGSVPSLRDERTFIDRALTLVRQYLAVDQIEELKR